MNNKPYYKEITAEHNLFDLKLDEVWRCKNLIWVFTKRDIVVRYKQTLLGVLNLFIVPIVSSLIYCFVFGNIAGFNANGIPQILFYLTGTALWGYFSSVFTNNANIFAGNSSLFGKVYFPRLTVSLSYVLTSLINFLISMILVAVLSVYYLCKGQISPQWNMFLLLPLLIIQLGLLAMSVGILFSCITTKYRDLRSLAGLIASLWMFLSPVVYPFKDVEARFARSILYINPVSMPFELFRMILFGSGTVNTGSMIWSIIITVITTLFAVMVFSKVERTFMDTV